LSWPGEQRLSDANFQEIEKSVQQLRQSPLENDGNVGIFGAVGSTLFNCKNM
jgi:hypothetical protein